MQTGRRSTLRVTPSRGPAPPPSPPGGPPTSDLARELSVSRPIVVEAYAQLAGEGYLELRPGARPRVIGCAGPCTPPTTKRSQPLEAGVRAELTHRNVESPLDLRSA